MFTIMALRNLWPRCPPWPIHCLAWESSLPFWAWRSPWARWAALRKKSERKSQPRWWEHFSEFYCATDWSARWLRTWPRLPTRSTPTTTCFVPCSLPCSRASIRACRSRSAAGPSPRISGLPFRKLKATSRRKLPKLRARPQKPPLPLFSDWRTSRERQAIDYYHQESKRARRTSRRRLESGLCRLRDRHDGFVHRTLADEQQRTNPESRGRLFQGPYRHGEQNRQQHAGLRGKFCRHQGQYGGTEGCAANRHPPGP